MQFYTRGLNVFLT